MMAFEYESHIEDIRDGLLIEMRLWFRLLVEPKE